MPACPEVVYKLLVSNYVDTGKNLAFEVFERSAAACGDVGHLISEAELDNSRRAVAAADDSSSVSFCEGLSNCDSAL